MPKIVAFVGSLGSGKTTAAKILASEDNWKRLSFAQPLKEIALIFGFDRANVFGNAQDKEKVDDFFRISAREFLQKLGTEVFREHVPKVLPGRFSEEGETVWCMLMRRKLTEAKENIVIDDCRFEDEAEMVRQMGGTIVRITRNVDQGNNPVYSRHASEMGVEGILPDVVINNNSSIEDLEKMVLELLK
jgi:hypothetical protein